MNQDNQKVGKPSTRVWNLMYVAGNPAVFSKATSSSSNPMRRGEAMEGAVQVAGNRWRVWDEHKDTGKRIFESEAETKYLASREVT